VRFRVAFAVLAALLLAACGTADKAEVKDEQLQRSLSAARSAYLQGQPELAVSLYREALERARVRDDGAAIAEISHDLGAAELQKGDAAAALASARTGIEELDRRQIPATAPLRLVEAVALYRLGHTAEAASAARLVAADGRADPVVRARAAFVDGLIAAQAGDLATVERALSQLPAPDKQPELAVDRVELTGWRALLMGDLPRARQAFRDAADGRRLALDYRGMGRVLAAAGDAAMRDGDIADAADLYLRAGRSAMIRGDHAQARAWLGRAETLADRARTPDLRNQARALMQEIAGPKKNGRAKP
jgi:tetratricopeptide (TPR) repeat protein